MNSEIQQFLESGLLEGYLMGLTSAEENLEVESYIQNFPQVRRVYESLQNDIEEFANSQSIAPPAHLKGQILQEIDKETAPRTRNAAKKAGLPYAAIAGVLALIMAALFFFSNKKVAGLNQELEKQKGEYAALAAACDDNEAKYATLEKQLYLIHHEATFDYDLKGKDGLNLVAYRNSVAKASLLKINGLPDLQKGKCYQLWADVDGKMLSLGVVPNEAGALVEIPFLENSESLNLTVEPEGGSEHPTVSDLVANVLI